MNYSSEITANANKCRCVHTVRLKTNLFPVLQTFPNPVIIIRIENVISAEFNSEFWYNSIKAEY